jgi:predicted membrane protein
MGFPLPDWLFSWHILLVAIGLFLGLRHNFRGAAWLILILVGGSFLIQDFYPKMELRRFIGPCVLIFIGFIILVRPKNRWRNHPWKDEWKEQMREKWRHHEWQKHHGKWMPPGGFGGPGSGPGSGPSNFGGPGGPNSFNNPGFNSNTAPGQYTPGPQPDPTAGPEPTPGSQSGYGPTGQSGPEPAGPSSATGFGANGPSSQTGGAFANSSNHKNYSSEDYIDTTSIFGGVHKKVVSKNFKGGDIVTFLGGSEIDLSQAEINGTARLDVTQVMGGTKIIVPAHWEVRSEVTALFAGFEDKRQQPAMINPDKVLIIDGTSIFGGIELKNY